MTFEAGKVIKDGGEGKIYEVLGHNDILLKIYKDRDLQGKTIVTQELQHKLEYMKKNPPIALINKGCLAWPVEILYSQGKLTGFVMPKLKSDYSLQQIYTYKHPLIDKNYDEYPSVQSRVGIAVNLAYTVLELHKAGYVIGDMNHENIGIDKTTAQIRVFDCDSFTITDNSGTTLRTNVCMEGYLAPEIIKHCNSERAKGCPYNLDTVALPTFTKESDLFCLAVHIFRSLMNGISPFLGVNNNAVGSRAAPFVGNEGVERNNYVFKQGLHPSAVYCLKSDEIPLSIKSLFDRAFLDGNSNPVRRPLAEEWYNTLSGYLGCLKQCSSDKKHQYYNTLSKCPYCEADERHYAVQTGISQSKQTSNKSVSAQIVPKAIISTTQNSNQWFSFQQSPTWVSTSQTQHSTFSSNQKKNHSGRNIFITIAAVMIGFILLRPDVTSDQQSTEPQFPPQAEEQPSTEPQNTSKKETQQSSINFNNESFTVAKYIHSYRLNVRSSPNAENDKNILFSVPLNSLVYLSDTTKDKETGWVKIKYKDDNHIGWADGAYLRDFTINNVQIGNNDDYEKWITEPGNKLYASQIKHFGIAFDVDATNNFNENTTLYIKIIAPRTFIQDTTLPSGFAAKWSHIIKSGSYNIFTSFFMKNSNFYSQQPGTWSIEIWYQNPKDEDGFYRIASKEFQLY